MPTFHNKNVGQGSNLLTWLYLKKKIKFGNLFRVARNVWKKFRIKSYITNLESEIGLQASQINLLNIENLELDYAKNFYYKKQYNMTLQIEVINKIRSDGSHTQLVMHLIENHSKSSSQLLQDLIAAYLFRGKSYGTFVEFGAADGKELSNTYYLEKSLKWHGVLAEPSRSWHSHLGVNRDCKLDYRCVWSESGIQLEFQETSDLMLSTVKNFSDSDLHALSRIIEKSYKVDSVSLVDLLIESSMPERIDFLSIDTEGSEFEILRNFNFKLFTFGAIVVEHNFTPSREPIRDLLVSNGYVPFLENMTEWDDWYLSAQVYEQYRLMKDSKTSLTREKK